MVALIGDDDEVGGGGNGFHACKKEEMNGFNSIVHYKLILKLFL